MFQSCQPLLLYDSFAGLNTRPYEIGGPFSSLALCRICLLDSEGPVKVPCGVIVSTFNAEFCNCRGDNVLLEVILDYVAWAKWHL